MNLLTKKIDGIVPYSIYNTPLIMSPNLRVALQVTIEVHQKLNEVCFHIKRKIKGNFLGRGSISAIPTSTDIIFSGISIRCDWE